MSTPAFSSFMPRTSWAVATLSNSTKTAPMKSRLEWRIIRMLLTGFTAPKNSCRSSSLDSMGNGLANRLRSSTSLEASSGSFRGTTRFTFPSSLTASVSEPARTSLMAAMTSAGTLPALSCAP